MNKYVLITIFTLSVLLTGCNDWLDVSPKTEVRETEQFSTEKGYQETVSGVYILLGKPSLYGMQATMYVPEFLAHTWTIPDESTDAAAYYLAQNNYTNSNAETTLDNLWTSYYNAIANINNIISHIEKTDVRFSGNQKQMITGEMYGLRAFLHLDIMRFFGPVPGEAQGSTSCIPYVKDLTTDVAKLKAESWDQVKADITADLDKAEELLRDIDPYVISAESADDESTKAPDSFTEYDYYRQLRFNYWAVLATKARLYYWTGDKEKAVEYAEKVIAATDKEGTQVFTLIDEAWFNSHSNGNLNMKIEHIFGTYNSNMEDDVIENKYLSSSPLFTQKEEYVSTAYESSLYPDDIRNKGTRYWAVTQSSGSTATAYHYYKYFHKGAWYGRYCVPCIRLSEMYLIVCEDAGIAEMMPYFKKWRLSRGLDSSVDDTMTSSSTVLSRMEKEWRKEFFGEGQMFFFYKKHNTAAYTWPTAYTVPSGAYQITTPQSQSVYEK